MSRCGSLTDGNFCNAELRGLSGDPSPPPTAAAPLGWQEVGRRAFLGIADPGAPRPDGPVLGRDASEGGPGPSGHRAEWRLLSTMTPQSDPEMWSTLAAGLGLAGLQMRRRRKMRVVLS